MTEDRVEEAQAPPTLLEELLRKSQSFMEGLIAERVKASLDHALDWTFRRIIVYLSAAVLFGTAAVFLLVAGMEGLKQAGAPPWSAYLLLGLLGGLGGSLLLRRPAVGKENGRNCSHSGCQRGH
jgi:hypothetical protein